jgi:tartrate dehydratase alpha subunit/fumarate hydratase class I-like protein
LKNGCRQQQQQQSLAILAKRDNYEHTRKAKAILQTFFQNSSYCREKRVVLCHAEAIFSIMTKVEMAFQICKSESSLTFDVENVMSFG